jgi:serine/threonine protein kinase
MKIVEGTELGRYKIRGKLGAGGMGEVFLAEDTRLHRNDALKILPEAIAGNKSRLQLFEQEARADGTLNQPNILALPEFSTQYGVN